MKYLHLYNNQTDYDNEKNTLILPSASLIEKNNHVEYNPHQYVEIAGIKWATMNVGAKSITDYGLYFQWGDTKGYTKKEIEEEHKKKFAKDWSDYKWYDKENSTSATTLFTKYYSGDSKTILDLEDDAVHAAWGGSWRMPTNEEFGKLGDAVTNGTVTKSFPTKDGVYGLLLTNGNKELFFPACGSASNGRMNFVGSYGSYWSKSIGSSRVDSACHLYFYNGHGDWQNNNGLRFIGNAVRGVWDDKQTKSNQ